MNQPNKSSTLWNVLDPDDPYDIKKSMISKMPNHPPQPMGRHLQIVCLLQAAEIERLSDYLRETQSKYREIERKELDRHSYEIQIKELTQKNISLNILQKENDRLKDFIRRQSLQLQEMQKKYIQSVNFEALQAKYEGLLKQLSMSRNQNQNAEKTISRLNLEITQWRSRWEKSDQERNLYISQLEVQFREKLNSQIKIVRERGDQRLDKLQIEMRQMKEIIDNKNHEIQNLTSQRQQLVREIRMLQEKNRNKGNIEQAINEKNRQIQKLNSLLSEKTSKLEQAMASNQKIGGELNIIEQRYRSIEKERQRLLYRIKELEVLTLRNENMQKLEEKVAMMSMEIERLNGLNSIRARECAEAVGEIERLKFQLRNTQTYREQLQRQKQRIVRLQNEIETLRVGQSRVKILTQELQRVRISLNTKNEEVYILQQKITQVNSVQISNLTKEKNRLQQQLQLSYQKIESLKITINSSQTNALDLAKLAKEKSTLQQELQASRTEFKNFRSITQGEINSLKAQNQKLRQESVNRSEYDKYRVETERLRAQIERIRSQTVNIRKFFQEQKAHTLKLQAQRNNLLNQNQNMLNQLLFMKREIQNLKLLAKGYDEKEKILQNKEFQLINLQRNYSALTTEVQDTKTRNQHLQATVQSIYNQIQRLHSVLSAKVNQNQKIMRDISQLEEKCRFYQTKLASNTNQRDFYEKEISKLRIELDNTTKMANQTSKELMNRLNESLMEKQRMEKNYRQKQNLILEYTRQKETLQKKLIEIQRQFAIRVSFQQQNKKQKEQLRVQRDQIKAERQKYYQEIRVKQNFILQIQNSLREKDVLIRQKENFIRESEGKGKVWESRVADWEGRLRDAERGIKQREDQIDRYKKENQRLTFQIQKFSQELQEIVRQREGIINQNNQLKRKIEQIGNKSTEQQLKIQLKMAQESLYRQRKQTQNLRNQCKSLEDNISRQSKEVLSFKETIREYQMKIVHIENTQTRVLQDRLKDYELKLQERDNLIIGLQRKVKQMEEQLASVLARDQDALHNLQKYEQKISLLSIEIERLNTKNEQKSRQCREKQQMILTLQRNNPEGKIRQYESKFRQYESKLVFYSTQVQKYRKIIFEKDRQLQEQGNVINTLNSRFNASSQDAQTISRYKIEITNLKTALQEYENINLHTIAERDELFKVSHQIKDQLDQLIFKSGEQEKQLRGELNYRLEQNRRFGEELGLLKKKQQTYLLKIEQLQRRSEDRGLRNRINQLQQQLQIKIRQMNQFKTQNTNLRQQINQLMIINQQLNIKISQSSSYSRDEVNRLTIKIKEMSLQLQSKDREIGQWEQKYNPLYSAYQQLYHNYQMTKAEYDVTIANIKIYQAKLFKIGEDYQAIAVALRSKQQEIYELKMRFKSDGDLYQKNLFLSKEIDRLTEINRRNQTQISQLRLNLTQNTTLYKRIEQQLALLVVLFAQIESLRSRLISSERQCEQVRRSSLVPCRVDKSKQNRL